MGGIIYRYLAKGAGRGEMVVGGGGYRFSKSGAVGGDGFVVGRL